MVPLTRKILVAIFTLVGAAMLVWSLRHIGINRVIAALAMIRPWQIAVILVLPFIAFAIAALRLKILLKGFGQEAQFFRLWRLIFTGFVVSYIAPSFDLSGQTVKALILSSQGLPRPAAMAALAVDSASRFLVNTVGGLLVAAGVVRYLGIYRSAISAATLTLIGVALAAIILWNFLRGGGSMTHFLHRYLPTRHRQDFEDFDRLLIDFSRSGRRSILSAILISAGGYIFEILGVAMALWFLGRKPDILSVAVIYLAIYVPKALPVPGGLGFAEAGGALAPALIGSSGALGLTVALLLRARDLTGLTVGIWSLVRENYVKFLGPGP